MPRFRTRRGKGFRATLEGYERVMRNAKSVEKAFPKIVGVAMRNEALRIMTQSQAEVPRVTGTLAASAYVNAPMIAGPIVSINLGYGKEGSGAEEYAVATHENPKAGQTGGQSPGPRIRNYPPGTYALTGKWKFLEGPATFFAATAPERMASEIMLKLRSLAALK